MTEKQLKKDLTALTKSATRLSAEMVSFMRIISRMESEELFIMMEKFPDLYRIVEALLVFDKCYNK